MSSSRPQGPRLLISLIIGSILTQGTHGAGLSVEEVFPDAMRDVKVYSGATATFTCTIVPTVCMQWAWNHNAELIFVSEKPMFSRKKYSQEYTGISGNHILRIANVSLQDEGPVDCMAMCSNEGPASTDWVKTVSSLIILVPPSDPAITYNGNMVTTVETRMDESVNLTCSVHGGRPTPTLIWHRGSTLIEELPEYSVSDWSTGDATYSSVAFRAMPKDNNADFTCNVQSDALPKPGAVQVKMSVKYPPVLPVITRPGGSQAGIDMGTRKTMDVRLKCATEGGNPPPELTWFVNDHMESGSKEQATASGAVDSILIFSAKRTDNGAKIRCEASNELMKGGFGADYRLELWFGPTSVTVNSDVPSGQMAHPNTTVQVFCNSEASNPAPDIHWFIDGKPYQEKSRHTQMTPDGSVSTSRLLLNLSDQRNVKVRCEAVNPRTSEKSEAAMTIEVDSPRLGPDHSGPVGVSDAEGNTLSPSWSLTTTAPFAPGGAERVDGKPQNLTMVIAVAASVGGAVFFAMLGCLIYVIVRGRAKKFEEMANSDSSGSSKGHTEVCSQTGMDTGTDTASSDVEKTPIDSYTQPKTTISPSAVRANAARTYLLDETYHSPYGTYKHWTAPEPGSHDLYNEVGVDFDGEGDYTEALRRTAMQSLMPHAHSPSPLRAIPHHLTYEPIHKTSMLSTFHGQHMPTYRAEALVDELKGHLV